MISGYQRFWKPPYGMQMGDRVINIDTIPPTSMMTVPKVGRLNPPKKISNHLYRSMLQQLVGFSSWAVANYDKMSSWMAISGRNPFYSDTPSPRPQHHNQKFVCLSDSTAPKKWSSHVSENVQNEKKLRGIISTRQLIASQLLTLACTNASEFASFCIPTPSWMISTNPNIHFQGQWNTTKFHQVSLLIIRCCLRI